MDLFKVLLQIVLGNLSQICPQILVFKLTEEALAKCPFFLLGNKFTFSLTLDQSHLGPMCIFLLPLAETRRSLPFLHLSSSGPFSSSGRSVIPV